MQSSNVLIAAGGYRADQIIEMIFRDEFVPDELDPTGAMDPAFIAFRGSVLADPLRPAAMVANTDADTEEEIEGGRAAACRVLHRTSFHANWLVTSAIPDAEAWIMADPAVREAVDRMDPTPASRRARIGRIDREAIARAFPDYRALDEFIKARVNSSEPVA